MSGALATPPAGADPMAGGAAPGGDAGADTDSDSDVLVTIVKNDDGSYTVYAGDEPDQGAGDQSDDDADAMGGAGGAPAPPASSAQGQPESCACPRSQRH